MKKKRIMSLVVLLIFASCVILPCFSVHVYAAEKKTTGYWKFVKSWDEQTSSLTHSGSNYNETISGSASGGFHDRSEIAADGYRFSYTSLEDRLHEGSCNGEYGEAVFTFSPLPGATLQSGEKLGITASVSCSTSGHHVGVSGQLMIRKKVKEAAVIGIGLEIPAALIILLSHRERSRGIPCTYAFILMRTKPGSIRFMNMNG